MQQQLSKPGEHDIFKVPEWEKSAAKKTLSSKAIIQNRRKDKEFPRQRLKELMITKPALQEILKGNP